MKIISSIACLALILLSLGCTAQEEGSKIEGSWASCSSGQYLEIHFLKDLYYVFTPQDSIGARRRYRYSDTTLYVYEYEQGDEVNRQFEVVLQNDSLTLKIANEEPMSLWPLEETYTDFNENDISSYYQKFTQRHKKSECYKNYENVLDNLKVDTLQIDDNFEEIDFNK